MEDIKVKIVDVMRTDAQLTALLGATALDTRLYPYYSGDAKITPATPGFITYSFNDPTRLQAVGMPYFTLAVWTREWFQAERIAARISALFHQKIHITAAPSSRRLYTRLLDVNDAYQQEPRYAGKNMHIETSWSTV